MMAARRCFAAPVSAAAAAARGHRSSSGGNSIALGRTVRRRPRGSRRRSGIQREVLGLYKNLLRAAQQKDGKTVDLVRTKFRAEAAAVTRFEFQKIEHLVRKGNKYVKLLQSDSVKRVSA